MTTDTASRTASTNYEWWVVAMLWLISFVKRDSARMQAELSAA